MSLAELCTHEAFSFIGVPSDLGAPKKENSGQRPKAPRVPEDSVKREQRKRSRFLKRRGKRKVVPQWEKMSVKLWDEWNCPEIPTSKSDLS